jgi:Protein of unknown function (DUF3237)
MRLEFLADLELVYSSPPTFLSPYGTAEGPGYGEGTGRFDGERLQAQVRFINHPRKRSDGRSLPDLHGMAQTSDGAKLVFHMTGRTQVHPGGRGVQNLAIVFETDDPRYGWINDVVCVAEGAMQLPCMQAKVFICVNEL